MRPRLSQRRWIPGPCRPVPAWADEAAQRLFLFMLRSSMTSLMTGLGDTRCESQLLGPPFCLASTCSPSFLYSEILTPETAPGENPGKASGVDRREVSAHGPLSLEFGGRVRGTATTSVHKVRAQHKALQVGPRGSEAGGPTAGFVSTCHSCRPWWSVCRGKWDFQTRHGRSVFWAALVGLPRRLYAAQSASSVPVRQDPSKTA